VKLLFDENLSRRLSARLADLFPESSHVVLEGLTQNPDIVVWEYASLRSEGHDLLITQRLHWIDAGHPSRGNPTRKNRDCRQQNSHCSEDCGIRRFHLE
jgi:hypothetical protein